MDGTERVTAGAGRLAGVPGALAACGIAWVATAMLSLTGVVACPVDSLVAALRGDRFTGAAFLSVALVLAAAAPSVAEVVVGTVLAVAGVVGLHSAWALAGGPVDWLQDGMVATGLAAGLCLAWRAVRRPGARVDAAVDLAVAGLLPAFAMAREALATLVQAFIPSTFEGPGRAMDLALAGSVILLPSRLVTDLPFLKDAAVAVAALLPVAMIVIAGLPRRSGTPTRGRLIAVAVWAGLAAVPFGPAAVSMTWALLACRQVRDAGRGLRRAAWACAALVALALLVDGRPSLIGLAVAVPLAFLLEAALSSGRAAASRSGGFPGGWRMVPGPFAAGAALAILALGTERAMGPLFGTVDGLRLPLWVAGLAGLAVGFGVARGAPSAATGRRSAICLGLLAAWSAASIGLFLVAPRFPVAFAIEPGSLLALLVEWKVAAVVLGPAAGLAACAAVASARPEVSGRSGLGSLGAALAGVACGVVVGVHGLLPALGLQSMLLVGVGISVLGALWALALPSRDLPDAAGGADSSPGPRGLAVAVLGGAGFLGVAFLAVASHLLAVVAGDTVFARVLVPAGFAAAFAAGLLSRLGAVPDGADSAAPMRRGAWLLLAAGASIFVALRLYTWEVLWLGSLGTTAAFSTFAARELARAVVVVAFVAPAAVFLGAQFAVTVRVGGLRTGPRAAIWLAAGLAGLGAVALLLPELGSRETLVYLGMAIVLLGLVAASGAGRAWRSIVPAALAILATVTVQGFFSTSILVEGANLHFSLQQRYMITSMEEGLGTGLTALRPSPSAGSPVRWFVSTNGRSIATRGDPDRSLEAESALFPLLHGGARDRALVVGLGTGGAAAMLADAGFGSVTVADPSAALARFVRAAWDPTEGPFPLDRREVAFRDVDGRLLLETATDRFDLVTVNEGAVFAGPGTLHGSLEFLQAARLALTPNGVFSRRLPLDHLAKADVIGALATVRTVFPSVWLYLAQRHDEREAVVVACGGACRPDITSLKMLSARPAVARAVESIAAGSRDLLADRLLTPAGVDALLAVHARGGAASLASTDDNASLELAGARANALPASLAFARNVALLRVLTPKDPFDGTALGAADGTPLRAR